MASVPRLRPSLPPRFTPCIRSNQSRGFASTTQKHASEGGKIPATLMKRMSKQQSMAGRMRSMQRGELPSDFGLLPETLVKPERKDLPSVFSSQWKRRLRIEWMAYWQKIRDFAGLYYLTRWSGKKHPMTGKRAKLPMRLRERAAAARNIHKQLYTAIATGDATTLSRIACSGLQQQTKIRMDHRKAVGGSTEDWKIQYRGITPPERLPWLLQCLIPFKSTKIISDRTAQLPIGNEASIRQCIVRIDSKQSLDKGDGKGPKSANLSEYVVIQKMTIDGKEDDWMIWGTTKPSSKEELNRFLAGNQEGKSESMMDRIKNLMPGMG